MKEHHDRFAELRDDMTEARTARGREMVGENPDYAYLRAIEAALSPKDRQRFRSIYGRECLHEAGVRASADKAVRIMRERASRAVAGDVVPENWRAH